MLIVSQNKEKVLWFGRAFNALEYSEQVDHKGKKETVRHTICISDGCLEETFDGVSVEYFGETALPLTAARFRINRDDVFLVVRQSDSLELLFNILKEII